MNATPPRPPVDPRIYLAAERTLLAWLRTGLALMGFGLVIAKLRFFLEELAIVRATPTPLSSNLSFWGGVLLVGLGIFVNLAAAIRHYRYLGQLDRFGADTPIPRRFPLVVASLLVLSGLLLLGRLMVTADWLAKLPSPTPREAPTHP